MRPSSAGESSTCAERFWKLPVGLSWSRRLPFLIEKTCRHKSDAVRPSRSPRDRYDSAMAIVRSLTIDEHSRSRPHPTLVDCRWQQIEGSNGATLFQLSTYGSDDRESNPKVSQTIQMDREIAAKLVAELVRIFDL